MRLSGIAYTVAGAVFEVLAWVLHERIQTREDDLILGYESSGRGHRTDFSLYRQRRLARKDTECILTAANHS